MNQTTSPAGTGVAGLPVTPVWARAARLKSLFGVSRSELSRLNVRTAKLGSSAQAGRLYCVADLVAELDRRGEEGDR